MPTKPAGLDIDSHFQLTRDQIQFFRKQGFIKLKQVLAPAVLRHYGWTFHRAGPNTSAAPRRVMTIIYIDADMRLAPPVNNSQQHDWNRWCPGAEIGEVINSPLNPILFEQQ